MFGAFKRRIVMAGLVPAIHVLFYCIVL